LAVVDGKSEPPMALGRDFLPRKHVRFCLVSELHAAWPFL
jgi:hypothetical protein